MDSHYDVIVVGGRCAGAATAMLLARGGLRVLVIEATQRGTDTLSTHALMRGGACNCTAGVCSIRSSPRVPRPFMRPGSATATTIRRSKSAPATEYPRCAPRAERCSTLCCWIRPARPEPRSSARLW